MSRAMNKAAAKEREKQFGWIEKTLSGISSGIEQAVFTEEHARKRGWLQGIDPRAKLVMFLIIVLAASLSSSLSALVALYLVLLLLAYRSQIPFEFFVRRVWIGIPFFAGIVIIPSIFLTTGPRLFDLVLGPIHFGPSVASIIGAIVFIVRVGVSVSLAVLLIISTPWADVLKGLRAFRVPQIFVLLLSMTYRYIFLFLHTTNGMFEARKSRTVGRTSGGNQRVWISSSMSNLMSRSFKMSNDVYAAMAARGFKGEVYSYNAYCMTTKDWLAVVGAICLAVAVFFLGRYLR